MPAITIEESDAEVERLVDAARAADSSPGSHAAIEAWRAVLAHPCAPHQVEVEVVLDDIHHYHRRNREWDEAIAAKREAIAAGYRSSPDPEADIAEVLVEADRLDEARVLYAELRARTPDDPWLYKSAALMFLEAGQLEESLGWALDGIGVAIATGDPDQVIADLRELAREASEELGLGEDLELEAAVAVFRAEWRPSPRPPIPGEPVIPVACSHCGWEPLASTPPRQPRGDFIERLARSAFTGAPAAAPGPAPVIDGPPHAVAG